MSFSTRSDDVKNYLRHETSLAVLNTGRIRATGLHLNQGRTTAVTRVALLGVVNPGGVTAEITVDPGRKGMNKILACSLPPSIATEDAIFPISGFALLTVTSKRTPARNG